MSLLSEGVARMLMAPALMVAAALLIKGSVDIGAGFRAGVVVTLAVAVLYLALGAERTRIELPLVRRAAPIAVAGILIALASGFFPLLFGEPLFSHLPDAGEEPFHIGTLELMTPVLFDVGVFLLVAVSLVALVDHLAAPPERVVESGEEES